MAAAWPKGRRQELYTDARLHRRLQPFPHAEGAEPNCLGRPECQSSVELAHQCRTNASGINQRVCLPMKLDRSARETLGWSARGGRVRPQGKDRSSRLRILSGSRRAKLRDLGAPVGRRYTTSTGNWCQRLDSARAGLRCGSRSPAAGSPRLVSGPTTHRHRVSTCGNTGRGSQCSAS